MFAAAASAWLHRRVGCRAADCEFEGRGWGEQQQRQDLGAQERLCNFCASLGVGRGHRRGAPTGSSAEAVAKAAKRKRSAASEALRVDVSYNDVQPCGRRLLRCWLVQSTLSIAPTAAAGSAHSSGVPGVDATGKAVAAAAVSHSRIPTGPLRLHIPSSEPQPEATRKLA